MRRLPVVELGAMALVVALAAISVFATLGSARASDLAFCHLVSGDVVVGATTDCSAAVGVGSLDLRPPPAGVDLCGDGPAVVVVDPGDQPLRAAALGLAAIEAACSDGGSSPDSPPPSRLSAGDPSPRPAVRTG